MANTSLLGSYGGIDGSALMFRNRIINGDMRIDQRNVGGVVTPTTDKTYTLDRWTARLGAASKFSVTKSATSVSGYSNSLLVTSLAATSLAAGDFYAISQEIEGFNIADLAWGTAAAQTVTISFWVRSSLTGTFGGSIRNGTSNRSYPFTFSISAANTFEYKTVVIPGDTSGTWASDNTSGIHIFFGLGCGSTFSGTAGSWSGGNFLSVTGATSVVGTNAATFFLTGVQLEAGPVATPFERRPYGTELALCQRYFQKISSYVYGATSTKEVVLSYPVYFRDVPTLGNWSFGTNGGATPVYSYAVSTTGYVYVSATNGAPNALHNVQFTADKEL